MKKILAVLATLAVTGGCVVAQAQSAPNKAVLEEHFNSCMGNKGCPIQVRLQIIQEENDEMKSRFQKVHQVCADEDFQDCIDKQKEDVDAWYAAQDKMQKMMQSMQTKGMKEKEPAAGDSSAREDKKAALEKNVASRGNK